MKSTRLPAQLLARTAAGLPACLAAGAHAAWIDLRPAHADPAEFPRTSAFERVLGTSLDLELHAPSAAAARQAEQSLLTEIERLRAIFDRRDANSALRRRLAGEIVEAPELDELLGSYALWAQRSGGAVSAELGAVHALWREAAVTGRLPGRAELSAARLAAGALDVDALGKAFIVERAAAVARELAPRGMINLGGDIRVWGDAPWMIGIVDPAHPADNAPPLVTVPVRDGAIASSGGFARNFLCQGRRLSHLIDPRTLAPIDARAAATVVADDCVTANALATAACVLGAEAAAPLARAFGRDHFIMPLAASASAADEVIGASVAGDQWPAAFELKLDLTLTAPARARRPYVAVWIEDSSHRVVRTLAMWGRQGKYLPEMTKWWRAIHGDSEAIRSVARPTRNPGAYTLAWDGRDETGAAVAAGTYRLCLEINREHGHHVSESIDVKCSAQPVQAELRATAESDAVQVSYGPR